MGSIEWMYIMIYDHWLDCNYSNVNKNEKNVLPTRMNIKITLYLTRRRQTFINIDQCSWKIYLSCFASVIDKSDYFVKQLHDPDGFHFDWWTDCLLSWLMIDRHWTVLIIQSNMSYRAPLYSKLLSIKESLTVPIEEYSI
jgi:hypothetical protein